MPKLSGNKGEWSEIYVFLRLLEIGRLYAADSELNKNNEVFYNILNIIRNEKLGNLVFNIDKEKQQIDVFNVSSNEHLISVSVSEFKNIADELLADIMKANNSAFSLEDIEEFLNKIYVSSLKAKSTDKADIKMKIHDINSGFEAVQGFSIKSRLGGASTLINAGKTTNFTYEVMGNMNDDIAHKFNNNFKAFL